MSLQSAHIEFDHGGIKDWNDRCKCTEWSLVQFQMRTNSSCFITQLLDCLQRKPVQIHILNIEGSEITSQVEESVGNTTDASTLPFQCLCWTSTYCACS